MVLNSDRFSNSSHFGQAAPSDLAAAQDTRRANWTRLSQNAPGRAGSISCTESPELRRRSRRLVGNEASTLLATVVDLLLNPALILSSIWLIGGAHREYCITPSSTLPRRSVTMSSA
jgi:hypothetical protein